MPTFPPGLIEWLQQGVPAGVVGLFLWTALKSQEKRIDELRVDMKEALAQQRADMKEALAQQQADMKDGFAQQRAAMAELKADNKALAGKLDRLVESLLTAKQS